MKTPFKRLQQAGLILQGDILHSSGELENAEPTAESLLRLARVQGLAATASRVSVHYPAHSYVLTAGRDRLHVVKVHRDQSSIDVEPRDEEDAERD